MKIHTITKKSDFDSIAQIIPDLPFNYIRSLPVEEIQNLFVQNCVQGIENNHHFIVIKKDSQIVGFASILQSDWDSKFFKKKIFQVRHFWIINDNKKIFKLLLNEIYLYCGKFDTIQVCLMYKSSILVQLFEREGFFTTDVHSTYFIDFAKTPIKNMDYGNIILREYQESDLELLQDIARTSYTQDRYHSDPYLPNKICDNFYQSWIKNSCSGEIADFTVVAELDNVPVGFTTLKNYNNFDNILSSRIGGLILSAVSEKAREGGIYTKMIHYGMKWLKDKNCRYTHLGTQAYNIPVQKAWIGLGYKIGNVNTWLNKWV